METNVVKERLAFVHDLESGHWSMTELCERYGVSRARRATSGSRAIEAGRRRRAARRSRAPQRCPHRTSDAQEAVIVAARRGVRLGRQEAAARAADAASEPSVAGAQYGQRDPRAAWAAAQAPPSAEVGASRAPLPVATHRPNQVWPADFKGQFRTGDGHYCYPLTVTDHFSRRVLACHGLRSVKTVEREAGVPRAVPRGRSAGRHPHRQRRAVRLDGHSRPGGAQRLVDATRHRASAHHAGQSARERHPRTDASRAQARDGPPRRRAALRAQQRRFDAFRQRYNDERPHEGIGDRTPSSLWCPVVASLPRAPTPTPTTPRTWRSAA